MCFCLCVFFLQANAMDVTAGAMKVILQLSWSLPSLDQGSAVQALDCIISRLLHERKTNLSFGSTSIALVLCDRQLNWFLTFTHGIKVQTTAIKDDWMSKEMYLKYNLSVNYHSEHRSLRIQGLLRYLSLTELVCDWPYTVHYKKWGCRPSQAQQKRSTDLEADAHHVLRRQKLPLKI
jgi:hypothetical protein